MTRLCFVFFFAAALSGCISFDFTDRSDIEYTRAIAMKIDPPVFRAGETITVRGLVVRPDGTHVTPDGTPFTNDEGVRACDGEVCFDWSFCFRPERTPGLESAQFMPERPAQGCEAADLSVGAGSNPFLVPNPDGTLTVDTAPIADMLDTGMLALVASALGLPEDVVQRILDEVGIPVVIELRVFDGDDVFVAFKSGLFVNDGCEGEDCLGQNPPAPQVEIYPEGDRGAAQWVTGRGVEEPFLCRPCDREEEGTSCEPTGDPTVTLEPEGRYILAPEEDVPSWVEPYSILTVTGEFQPAEEAGFFSFFTNRGTLEQEKTRYPAAEEIFVAPAEPGVHAIWVVVRDGHYGQDACRIDFRIP